MALFSKDNKEEKTAVKAKPAKRSSIVSNSLDAHFSHVLLRPMVTEKAHMMQEQGCYAFYANVDISKTQVKNAVEHIYGVHVTSVSSSRIKPKKRVRGRETGYTKRMKKVMVSVRKGESITLFESA